MRRRLTIHLWITLWISLWRMTRGEALLQTGHEAREAKKNPGSEGVSTCGGAAGKLRHYHIVPLHGPNGSKAQVRGVPTGRLTTKGAGPAPTLPSSLTHCVAARPHRVVGLCQAPSTERGQPVQTACGVGTFVPLTLCLYVVQTGGRAHG